MNTYNGPIEEVKLVEKVKVKQEIATAIESVKSDTHWSLDSFLDSHARNENSGGGESWTDEFYPLNKLSVSELAKAFFIGYSVEPEQPKFQPGDKVVRETGGEFLFNQLLVEVIGVSKNQWFEQQIEYEIEGSSYFLGSEYVRHATPEEIYWLETLGREKVGDFQEGDVVLGTGLLPYIVSETTYGDDFLTKKEALKMYENDFVHKVYPASTGEPVPGR